MPETIWSVQLNERRAMRVSLARRLRTSSCLIGSGVAGFILAMHPNTAKAVNLYDGVPDGNAVQVNLTTTLEYSTFYRVNEPSASLTNPANANTSEGDLNFRHGFFSNEVEALPVLDLRDGDFGAHVSGEFYLNTLYLQENQNNQPSTVNPFSVGSSRDFTSSTRNINGQNGRLLDAFVYGRVHVGHDENQTLSLKVGRQTLLWGQSLFFTNNGIAAGQAPIDLITAQSLPNPQAQQVFLPVGQVVATYQPDNVFTFQGYYQFEWKPDNFQGVGSYFSTTDFLDKGGERLIAAPGAYFFRVKDNRPPAHNGQFGASVQAQFGDYDIGLYAVRFDSKAPQVYGTPGAPLPTANGLSVGNYRLVYPRDIQIFGTSLSTSVGPANVGAEISARRNMPLVSGLGISIPNNPGGASTSNALYAVGNTFHAQASTIYLSPGVPLDPGGLTIDGEVEMNHVLAVTHGREFLTPGRDSTAAAFELVISPTYYNVLPSLEIQFPIGFTYNFIGRSEIDPSMQHSTGSVSVGVTGTWRGTWIAGVTYNDYLGKPDPNFNDLADRGYVSFNVQHTF